LAGGALEAAGGQTGIAAAMPASERASAGAAAAAADTSGAAKTDAVGLRPAGLKAPRNGAPDNLRRISGLGPADEKHLHGLGIFHYDQIAAWTPDETRWVSAFLSSSGRVERIEREQWPEQAAELVKERGGASASAGSSASAAGGAHLDYVDDAAAQAQAVAEEVHVAAELAKLPADATPVQKANAVGARPAALPGPRAEAADNLQRIKGVGPVNEKHLHDLGVFHFDQIAAWTRAEIRWVGTYLAFPGRIDREQWVTQAANLAHGGQGLKDGVAHVLLDRKPGA
jgi:predicted flap endonuclease-1-like 5' DNA nuclease